MKALIKILSVVMMLVVFTSCNNKQSEQILGVQDVYENFLWKKYDIESAWMYDTLSLDFNRDAQKYITQPIRLQLSTTVPVSETRVDTVPLKNIEVSQNGQLCKDNIITITKNDTEVIIGVRYKLEDDLQECKHNVYLKHVNPEDLSMPLLIDDLEFHGVTIEKNRVSNPLKVAVSWIGICIGVILVLIGLFGRLSNPKIKFTVGVIFPVSLIAARKNEARIVILTNNRRKKQSFVNLLFKGKTKYVYMDNLVSDIILTSATRGVRVKTSYICTPCVAIMNKVQNNGIYTFTSGNSEIKIQIR